MSKTYYYARVSTSDQTLSRQFEAFRKINPAIDERDIITDKATGKNFDRTGYQYLKSQLVKGDTLVIKEIDRLGRNKIDILRELNWMRETGIRVKIIDIPTTMIEFDENIMHGQEWIMDMVNGILIEVYTSIAQQELEHRATRQAEGYAAMDVDEKGRHISAKTGEVVGRKAAVKPANWDAVIAAWKAEEITATAAAKKLGLGRTTFYKLLKEGV